MANLSSHADLLAQLSRCSPTDRKRFERKLLQIDERQKEGKPVDRMLNKLAEDIASATGSSRHKRQPRNIQMPKIAYDDSLPICARREEITEALAQHQTLVICGETGSGKSTQLPKICLDAGRGRMGMIGHTQPRRIAARSIASRLREEMQTNSKQVSYKVRFADDTSPDTLIKVMTDGILLNELQRDRNLNQYDTIIIDEAHERSLNIDFLLGYLKRLQSKRDDLKLIITSATIDPQRFSDHFDQAPIIEVTGRTYPVEVRYHAPQTEAEDDDEPELVEMVGQAVQELLRESRGRAGDILIFFSGEREIREASKYLSRQLPSSIELLPLMARLSPAEQMRVFESHRNQRIVLATNVAETSITVPGIRYVIDTGLARISRYSARAGVQRLPIEPISQASANQRKGRCGRVAEGICIRLYSEESYESREAFTQPEIQRTNLASVILQMESMRLGHVDDFPFVDPPKPGMVRDGYKTLFELGAIDADRKITQLGRQMSRLPVDPRLARMLFAADREGALRELLVLTAAMSVQDPRLRPMDAENKADAAHEQFRDETSDYLTLLNVWKFTQTSLRKLSHSKFRKACATNFLSHVRLREWMDVHRQLSELVKEQKLRLNDTEAKPDQIHQALLAGLITNVGNLNDGYEYEGVGGTKFHLFPGSVLFGAKPKWVMAGELVETGRLYARMNAPIQPQWIERLAPHMVRLTHSNPRWQRESARALTDEKVSLGGLTLVNRRTIPLAKVNTTQARELFIQHALVEQDYDTQAPFFKHNRDLQEQVEKLESKVRRRDLLVEQRARFHFYDQRIPAGITDGPTFEKWRQEAERSNARLLYMTQAHLLGGDTSEITKERYPDHLTVAGRDLALAYHFDESHEADGITLTVPLEMLHQLDERQLSWLVPGMWPRKIEALIRSLPKSLRKAFVPAPDWARRCAEDLVQTAQTMEQVIAERLGKLAAVPVRVSDFNRDELPEYLKISIRLLDEQGKQIDLCRDLSELRERWLTKEELAIPSLPEHPLHQDGLKKWTFGQLPEQVEIERTGGNVAGYPAVIDRGQHVDVRILHDRHTADMMTRRGLRRLARLELSEAIGYQWKLFENVDTLAQQFQPLGKKAELKEQLLDLLADRAVVGDDVKHLRDANAFESALNRGWNRLDACRSQINQLAATILSRFARLMHFFKQKHPPGWARAVEDARGQFALLMQKDLFVSVPYAWLGQYPRYLQGIEKRFEKIRSVGIERDQANLKLIQRHWTRYLEHRMRYEKTPAVDPYFEQFRWSLEEFRIACFAQELGTAIRVSEKRLEELWENVRR